MNNKKIVITNLRVPPDDWNQLRAIAAERGMSANQYINLLMRNVISPHAPEGRSNLWSMPKLAKKAKAIGFLSPDDNTFYG